MQNFFSSQSDKKISSIMFVLAWLCLPFKLDALPPTGGLHTRAPDPLGLKTSQCISRVLLVNLSEYLLTSQLKNIRRFLKICFCSDFHDNFFFIRFRAFLGKQNFLLKVVSNSWYMDRIEQTTFMAVDQTQKTPGF